MGVSAQALRPDLDSLARFWDSILESIDGSQRDSLARQIYKFSSESRRMGEEAIAIHLTDKWFATGRAHFETEEELMLAKVNAEFGRRSQLGMKAQPLQLIRPDGVNETVEFNRGRPTILYIYDTSCAKCKLESVRLQDCLDDEITEDVDFVALYAGTDSLAWAEFREGFHVKGVRHYWDPLVSSDYQRKYDVLATPRLFLIAADGTIGGRRLGTDELSVLLPRFSVVYRYGEKTSSDFFASLDMKGAEDISFVRDYLASSTLEKGDSLTYAHLAGDLLYYLSGRRDAAAREASLSLALQISSSPEIWSSRYDSLSIIPFARMLTDLLSRNAPGTKLPGAKVPGTLIYRGRSRQTSLRLDKIGGSDNYVFLYSSGCKNCDEQLGFMKEQLVSSCQVRAFLVDLDALLSTNTGLFSRLADSFDLRFLPCIVRTGKDGRVKERYVEFSPVPQALE